MSDGPLRRLGLGLLVTTVVALLALNVMAWTGVFVEESAPPPHSVPVRDDPAVTLPGA